MREKKMQRKIKTDSKTEEREGKQCEFERERVACSAKKRGKTERKDKERQRKR